MLRPENAPSINNYKNDSPAPRLNKKGLHDPRLLSKDAEEHVTHVRPKQELSPNVDLDLLRESIRQYGSSSQSTPHEAPLPLRRTSVHSEEKQPAVPPRSLVGNVAPTARGPLRISNVVPTRETHKGKAVKAVAGNPMAESFVHEQRQRYVPPSPSSSENDYYQVPELGMQKHLHGSQLVEPLSHVSRPIKPPLQSPSSSSTSSEPFPDLKPGMTSIHQSKQQASSTSIFKPSVPLPYPTRKDGNSMEVASIYRKGDSTKNDPTANHLTGLIGAQPPLPSGPPTSSWLAAPGVPSAASHANAASADPPLPPGLPPTSSFVREENPLSSLLSTLVAKGLISSPSTTEKTSVSNLNKTEDTGPGKAESVKLKPVMQEILLVGHEFKPEVMREYHPNVINSLFDDMSHQCQNCGLRFELKDQLDSHLEWHESDKPCTSRYETTLGVSRRWYADSGKWVDGSFGIETDQQVGPTDSLLEDDAWLEEERSEPMVPADERQILCALCGEPFGDVYCFDTEQWMYRDAVYLDMACSVEGRIIAHDKCVALSR